MADGRMLRKKASIDRRLAQLTDRSGLLYLLSIPHLDDGGRMIGLPAWVRGTVAAARAEARPDDWTDERVADYMTEWTHTHDPDGQPSPLVLRYRVNEQTVCMFVGFANNQKLRYDRPPNVLLPPPPPELLAQYGLVVDGLRLLRTTKPPHEEDRKEQVRGNRAPEVEVELEVGRPSSVASYAAHGLPVDQQIQASLSESGLHGSPPARLGSDLGRLAVSLADLEPRGPVVLPPDDLRAIVGQLCDADDGTLRMLERLRGRGLPPAAFQTALESLRSRRSAAGRPALQSEVRYFVAALNSMLREGQYGPPVRA